MLRFELAGNGILLFVFMAIICIAFFKLSISQRLKQVYINLSAYLCVCYLVSLVTKKFDISAYDIFLGVLFCLLRTRDVGLYYSPPLRKDAPTITEVKSSQLMKRIPVYMNLNYYPWSVLNLSHCIIYVLFVSFLHFLTEKYYYLPLERLPLRTSPWKEVFAIC